MKVLLNTSYYHTAKRWLCSVSIRLGFFSSLNNPFLSSNKVSPKRFYVADKMVKFSVFGFTYGCLAFALQYFLFLSGSLTWPFLQHWPQTNFIFKLSDPYFIWFPRILSQKNNNNNRYFVPAITVIMNYPLPQQFTAHVQKQMLCCTMCLVIV